MSAKHNLGTAAAFTLPSGSIESLDKTSARNYHTRLEVVENKINFISDNLANVINTGFKDINENFHELRNIVAEIKNCQVRVEEELKLTRIEKQELKDKIEEITNSIYDPDNGIYRRINESNISEKTREDKLDLVVSKIENIESVAHTEQILKRMAGDNLEEINTLIKAKKLANKVIWVLLTALIGGGVTMLWQFIN